MNELKPEDVMMALECHSGNGDCFKVCPYFTNIYDSDCLKNLVRDALALLREKDAEIERLTRVVKQRNEQLSDLVKIILQKSGRHPLLRKRTMMIEIIRNDAITEFCKKKGIAYVEDDLR